MKITKEKKDAILVAGGAGFIGINLIKELNKSKKDHKIIIIDNLILGNKENIPKNSNFKFINLDISEFKTFSSYIDKLNAAYSINEIWHLAANSDIPSGVKDLNVDYKNTFLTTLNIIKAFKKYNLKKLHFASSSAIYGDFGDKLISEESGPLMPISNYGTFKLASEAVLSSFVEDNNCKLYIYRFPNVVGSPASHGIIYDFVKRLYNDSSILEVFGNGFQKKIYLHVEDLLAAMLFINSNSNQKRNIFNIGPNDDGVYVKEIAENVAKKFNCKKIIYGKTKQGWTGDVPKYSYLTSKIKHLGWVPKYKSSKEAINKAIIEIYNQFFRKNF